MNNYEKLLSYLNIDDVKYMNRYHPIENRNAEKKDLK